MWEIGPGQNLTKSSKILPFYDTRVIHVLYVYFSPNLFGRNIKRCTVGPSGFSFGGFSFNVPPSFQRSDLPAARRWLDEAGEDLKAARKNFSAGSYNYAAYAARMVSLTCQ